MNGKTVLRGPRSAAPVSRVRAAAFAALALLHATTPLAENVPAPGVVDSRIRSAPYDSEQVYRLRGFAGYEIDLEFEVGESFVGLGAGDIDGVAYFAAGNHLFLKPKAARVATNLTVLTSRRQYQFDYAALPQQPSPQDTDVVYALRFTYPPPPAPAAEADRKRLDAELEKAAALRPANLDYWYCGAPALRPVAAADDGVHTRLRFAANGELPGIFLLNDDASESLLNFHMDAGDVIVHQVARRFIVRRGRLTGCIVNRGFVGGGARLDSGTVAPEVERTVPGAAP